MQQLQRKQSQRRQTITQRDARHLFRRLAAAKERQEEINNNQHRFFFRWGEGAISPAPKKDDGARCCGKGASLSRAQWEQTRAACGCTMKRERDNHSNSFIFLSLVRGRPSQPRKDDGVRTRDAVGRGRLLSASARARWGNTTINKSSYFHFHL